MFWKAVVLCCILLMPSTAPAFQPVYVMASGNMGGTYYGLGGVIAETVNNYVPGIRFAVLPSEGSEDNVDLMEKGLCQFALLDSFAVMAYRGRDIYYENPQTYLRSVIPLYPEVARILVGADSGISDVADLAGKRIVLGRRGSGVLITARQIIRAAGLKPGQVKPAYLGMGEGLLALEKGEVDAVVFVGPLGGGSAMEQEALKKVEIVGLNDGTINNLLSSAPYWNKFSIPAGTFAGQTADIDTVGAWTVLYCREDLNADLVYKVTKTIYEKANRIASYIPGTVKLTPDDVGKLMIPMHDGALRFFKEEGNL